MNRWLFGLVACVALASVAVFTKAAPPDRTADQLTYKFVGYSDQTVIASTAGFVGVTAACQAKFGVGARIATTEEFAEASSFPTGHPTELALIRPTVVTMTPGASTTSPYVFDASGNLDTLGSIGGNCAGYSRSDAIGTVVKTANGGLQGIGCSYPFPLAVACSAPQ